MKQLHSNRREQKQVGNASQELHDDSRDYDLRRPARRCSSGRCEVNQPTSYTGGKEGVQGAQSEDEAGAGIEILREARRQRMHWIKCVRKRRKRPRDAQQNDSGQARPLHS